MSSDLTKKFSHLIEPDESDVGPIEISPEKKAHYENLARTVEERYKAEGGEAHKKSFDDLRLRSRFGDLDFTQAGSFYQVLQAWIADMPERHRRYTATSIHSRFWSQNDEFMKDAIDQIQDVDAYNQARLMYKNADDNDELMQITNFTLWNKMGIGTAQEQKHRQDFLDTMTRENCPPKEQFDAHYERMNEMMAEAARGHEQRWQSAYDLEQASSGHTEQHNRDTESFEYTR